MVVMVVVVAAPDRRGARSTSTTIAILRGDSGSNNHRSAELSAPDAKARGSGTSGGSRHRHLFPAARGVGGDFNGRRALARSFLPILTQVERSASRYFPFERKSAALQPVFSQENAMDAARHAFN